MPTTNGSPIYRDHVPAADAWVVERLRNLGATIFGKTVSTEFAWRHPGPTVNPWNPQAYAGRLVLGLGGGGCGGHRAAGAGHADAGIGDQAGRLQRRGRLQAELWRDPPHRRASAQPVARSRRLLRPAGRRRRAGAVAARRLQRQRPAWPARAGVRRLDRTRAAAAARSRGSPSCALPNGRGPSPSSRKLFEAAIAKLRDAGAVLEELELAELDQANWDAINTILASEGAVIFGRSRRAISRPHQRSFEIAGSRPERPMPPPTTSPPRRCRKNCDPAFAASISGFDAVLTLPAFGEAPEGLSYTGDAEYCAPWTLLGVPALSLPAGFGKKGLAAGPAGGRRLSRRPSNASGGEMDRGRVEVRSRHCRNLA